MDLIRSLFLKNQLLKNISLIAGGTFSSQAIGIVFTLIVARLYSPSDFGVMSIFASTIGILNIGTILTYEKSIPIVRNEDEAKLMVKNCLVILICTSSFIFGVCLFANENLMASVNVGAIYDYRFALPVAVFLTGLYTIALQWVYRKRTYSLIPRTQIIQSLAGGMIKVAGGILSPQVLWLISGTIVNEFLGVSSLLKQAIKDRVFAQHNLSLSWDILKSQYRFPLFMLPNDIINAFAVSGPVLILAYLYDPVVCGYYGMVNTVVNLPMNLVCMSISKVVYAEAAHLTADNAAEIRAMCWKVTKWVGCGAIIPLGILYIWGPDLFSFVLGSKWYVSGEYARLMIGYFWVYSMVLPTGRVLEVFNKQWIGLVLNVFRVILLVLLVVFLKTDESSVEKAILSLSLLNTLVYGAGLLICFIVLGRCVRNQSGE